MEWKSMRMNYAGALLLHVYICWNINGASVPWRATALQHSWSARQQAEQSPRKATCGQMDQQDHAVDIASLAQELREELANVNSSVQLRRGPPPCIIIDKVAELTRNIDPVEYDPHYVSVGPYHRIRNPHLARDADKIRSLDVVLSAANPRMTMEVYLAELAHLEGRARSCYAHSFACMTSKEFVRMLLLDGCYILFRFGAVYGRRGNGAATTNSHVLGGYGSMPSLSAAGSGDKHEDVEVVRDVFYLAENQIPFFVVDKIHQLTILDGNVPAVDGIASYVRELLRGQQYSVVTPTVVAPPRPGNLLHLLHMHLKPNVIFLTTGGSGTAGKPVGRWRTATEYHFAGVKFKSRAISTKGVLRSILDVKVSSGGGTLEVPRLNIDSETWPLLRNLMALEQRNPEAAGSHVTAYCVFMSQVACTARDVEFLSRRGVIVHGLGNHGEVAGYFANLCKGIVFDADDPGCNYLTPVCQALENRFRSRPRRWVAWLWHKYFSNPWLAVGLVAAAIGLACTVVQAVYSVLSYKQSGAQGCHLAVQSAHRMPISCQSCIRLVEF